MLMLKQHKNMSVVAPAPPAPDQRPHSQEWFVRVPEPTNFRITPLVNDIVIPEYIPEGPVPIPERFFLDDEAVHVAAVPPESVAPYTPAPLPEGFDKYAASKKSVFDITASPVETIYPQLVGPKHLSVRPSNRNFRAGVEAVRSLRSRAYKPRHIRPEGLN